jgi:hypothetical protein
MNNLVTTSLSFYQNLPAIHRSSQGFLHPEHSVPIPDDWVIVVTDVENSSDNQEKYREINILAASSVIIAINIGDEHGVQIPFVYGGDGATIVLPNTIADLYLKELAILRANGNQNFNLHLRIGSISVGDVRAAGHQVSVAKLLINGSYSQAIFFGDGIDYAEDVIKRDDTYHYDHEEPAGKPIDLNGLECKWNEIHPPRDKEEVVCLLVKARNRKYNEQLYREVLDDIDKIYGNFDERYPLPTQHIGATNDLRSIIHASRIKFGRFKFRYVMYWFVAGLWSRFNGWAEELRSRLSLRLRNKHLEMTTSSDTLKISGTLMTMFAGSSHDRARLEGILREYEAKGLLWYGIHPARSSVMTCYINTPNMSRVNFLDAYGGGYTRAASMMKEKIRSSEQ